MKEKEKIKKINKINNNSNITPGYIWGSSAGGVGKPTLLVVENLARRYRLPRRSLLQPAPEVQALITAFGTGIGSALFTDGRFHNVGVGINAIQAQVPKLPGVAQSGMEPPTEGVGETP